MKEFIRMVVTDAKLRENVMAFRDALQKMALFDEAHCVGVALESPSLRNGIYISTHLQQAAAIAAGWGLIDVSDWIANLLSA